MATPQGKQGLPSAAILTAPGFAGVAVVGVAGEPAALARLTSVLFRPGKGRDRGPDGGQAPQGGETSQTGALPAPGGVRYGRFVTGAGAELDDGLLVRPTDGTMELHVHGSPAVVEALTGELGRLGVVMTDRLPAVPRGVAPAIAAEVDAHLPQAVTWRAVEVLAGQAGPGLAAAVMGRLASAALSSPDRSGGGTPAAKAGARVAGTLGERSEWETLYPRRGERADGGAVRVRGVAVPPAHAAPALRKGGQVGGNERVPLPAGWVGFEVGRRLVEPPVVVFVGAPNAGKSTLANRLFGRERSLVSPLPGTTRDRVDGVVDPGGFGIRITDTAGLRATDDAVEAAGVAGTRAAAGRADLVLLLEDGTVPPDDAEVLAARREWLPSRESTKCEVRSAKSERMPVAQGGVDAAAQDGSGSHTPPYKGGPGGVDDAGTPESEVASEPLAPHRGERAASEASRVRGVVGAGINTPAPVLLVRTKCDRPDFRPWNGPPDTAPIAVSGMTGEGVEVLAGAVLRMLGMADLTPATPVLFTERQAALAAAGRWAEMTGGAPLID